jgi:hypothetical protein
MLAKILLFWVSLDLILLLPHPVYRPLHKNLLDVKEDAL